LTVGANRTKRVAQNEQASVGMNQRVSVGINRSTHVGAIDSTTVGETHVVSITPPGEWGQTEGSTSILMQDKKIVLDTGAGAKITMEGPVITISAMMVSIDATTLLTASGLVTTLAGTTALTVGSQGVTSVHGQAALNLSSSATAALKGSMVEINGPGLFAGRVTDLAPAAITRGSATVLIGGPTFPFDVVRNPDGTIQVGNNISIAGDETYQRKVLADLSQISQTPTGLGLLNSIDGGSKSVTITPIVPPNTGNSCSYDSDARFYNDDGTPGAGANSTIEFDPDLETISSQPWGTRPSAIGLAHELGHADQASHGTTTEGESSNDSVVDPTDPTGFDQVNTRELE
jgi:hypothetical protein